MTDFVRDGFGCNPLWWIVSCLNLQMQIQIRLSIVGLDHYGKGR